MGPHTDPQSLPKGAFLSATTWPVPLRLALLEAFLDTSNDAVFSLDLEGRVTSWNRSAERIFGYLEAEIVGENLVTLFPSHLRPEVAVELASVSAGDAVNHFETEIQRKDGMPTPISLSARPVLDTDGNPVASAAIARDITEQRLAQATLAEIEARAREGEALAHVGGWLWDVRTGAVQWTDELHRIHGIDPLDFDGTFEGHIASVHHEDRQRVRAAMEACVASGSPFELEYRILGPDGDVRWLYARGAPTIGSAGTVVGLRGISQEETGRSQVLTRPRRET
jgi:PAS domain S-box-containing protein